MSGTISTAASQLGRAAHALPRVTLHRSGWGEAPANSLRSLRAAIASGADAVELDVQRTADGILAVVHDPEPVPYRNVRHMTETLAELRAHNPEVATLDEFLAEAAGRIGLVVEVKHPGVGAETMAALRRHRVPARDVTFASFDPFVLRELRSVDPSARLGLLASTLVPWDHGGRPLELATSVGADFVVASTLLAGHDFLDGARALGLPALVYVPWAADDTPFVASLLADPRVAGVIANNRDAAMAARMLPKQAAPLTGPLPWQPAHVVER